MSETSDIVSPILDALKQAGIFAMRMNSGKMRVRGGYVHLCPVGTPDIVIYPCGRVPVWIECKVLSKKLRQSQIEMRVKLKALGHRVVVAFSLDDIIPLINELR